MMSRLLDETTGSTTGADAVYRRTPRSLPTSPALAPAILGFSAFLLGAAGSWIPAPWYDEAATITSASRSWSQLFTELGSVDAVHGLYYSLMHVVFEMFGYSPLTLRLPSAIAVGLTAALLVVLLRRLSRPRLGILAAIVFAVLPRVSWMATEGRSYAFTALLAVALSLLLVTALRSGRRRWFAAYALGIVVSCLVFVYLPLIAVVQGAFVLAWRRAHPNSTRPLLRWAVAVGAATLALGPFLTVALQQKSQIAWIEPIGPATLHQVFTTQWFSGSDALGILYWAILLVGAGLLVLRRGSSPLATLVVACIALPTLALLAITALYDPIYSPRYLTMSAPFVAIAMAAAFDAIPVRWMRIAAVVALVALLTPHLIEQREPEAKEDSSWSRVAALIGSERAADPTDRVAVIYGPLRHHPTAATTSTIAVSYPSEFAGTIDVTLDQTGAERGTLWESRLPLSETAGRVSDADVTYLIASDKRDARASTTGILEDLGWHVTRQWHFTDVNVVKYER